MRTGDYLIQTWRMRVASKWIPPGSRVLDIGCHQGELFEALGGRIAPSIGIDPLLPADRLLGRHQLLCRRFERSMPFPDGSFDVITLLAVLEHMNEKSVVAAECWRLAHPGGRVIITVPSETVDRILDVLVSLRLVDGMSLEEHHGFLPAQVPALFEQAGFKLMKWKKFQLGLNNLFVFER